MVHRMLMVWWLPQTVCIDRLESAKAIVGVLWRTVLMCQMDMYT